MEEYFKRFPKRLKTFEETRKEKQLDILTLQENRFGHIHVFRGDQSGKLICKGGRVISGGFFGCSNFETTEGKESDKYLQFDYEIKSVQDRLPVDKWEELENGYEVVVDNPDLVEYLFGEEE
jgi:hypothetical protein